jgi:hypothetical protein
MVVGAVVAVAVAAEVVVAAMEVVAAMAAVVATTISMFRLPGLPHLHGARHGALASVRRGVGPLALVSSALTRLLIRPTRPINP